jgi:dTDP-4-dehydrorhamnose 3,5-epimerase
MGKLMEVRDTPIADLFLVMTAPHRDERGSFARFFCEKDLASILGDRKIVQINHSCTHCVGALRGLHFQTAPHAEMKLVRCIQGRVWDVAVDLRRESSTFLNWHARELSADNHLLMVIPEGFAHGFQVLEQDSELLYLHTALYTPGAEGGIRFDDPRLSIKWPLSVTDVSQRDLGHPLIRDEFRGISL